MLESLSVSVRSQWARQGGMVTRTRQVILVIVLLFIAYAIYRYPTRSADAVQALWNFLVSAFNAVFTFFNRLITG